MPPVLQAQNVSFRRGRGILHDVSWTIERGQHWCILGPNGCGKTSLINLVTGYEMATEGVIRIGGDVFGESDWREVRKRVGLVTSTLGAFLETDEPAIHAVASGREAMLNVWGRPARALIAEAARLMEGLGIGYLRESLWGVLSQGERQKILICRALMARFEVLILDEPCAGLDPVSRETFLRWLQSLGERPEAPTLVMVTHHVEEILPCMTHVLMLKSGRVFASGETHRILNSARLGEIYGHPVKLARSRGRYSLRLLEKAGSSPSS